VPIGQPPLACGEDLCGPMIAKEENQEIVQ
jgi:hypothetical protein